MNHLHLYILVMLSGIYIGGIITCFLELSLRKAPPIAYLYGIVWPLSAAVFFTLGRDKVRDLLGVDAAQEEFESFRKRMVEALDVAHQHATESHRHEHLYFTVATDLACQRAACERCNRCVECVEGSVAILARLNPESESDSTSADIKPLTSSMDPIVFPPRV